MVGFLGVFGDMAVTARARKLHCAALRRQRSEVRILSGAPFPKLQGPWTVVQVTVSKRLTFWNRSLIYHGVGKVADKLLAILVPNFEVIAY